MSTLLDEILRETTVSAVTKGSCSSHETGCKCIECSDRKAPSPLKHKNWKERKNKRLNTKGKRNPGARKNVLPVAKQEFEWEYTAPPNGAHVILVAGHNWSSPGHKFITYCFNRCKRLLKKDDKLKFTVFDFSSGKVIFGKLVNGKLDWIELKKYETISPAHYTKTGKRYVFNGDRDVLSVTEVYKYIRGIGTTEPSSVTELSFFGHGWMGGPILVNSYDAFQRENWKSERDPYDSDPRTFKDFNEPNMSGAGLSNFKNAFAPGSFVWVWGCAFTTSYFQVLHRVLKSKIYRSAYPRTIGDDVEFDLSFNSLQADDFFGNDAIFFPPKDAAGKFPKAFKRKFKDIKDYLRRGIADTYAVAIAKAAGVPCRSALLGTYADYEKNQVLPLMVIPRKVPPYSDNFTSYINFYKNYLSMNEDPESRGYGIYLP